jgi:signal transduction histidine kinase
MRPLDRVRSIKVKFSIVIVVAVAISALVSTIGLRVGIPIWLRPPIAAAIALAITYPVARGLTKPVRDMAAVTDAMAQGKPAPPVTATSLDEVGRLARSFNEMRAQLDEVDRQRRDLVANVSHELRTPIAALQATLENIVDGIEEPNPQTLKVMLAQTERLSRMVAQLLDLSRLESGGSPLHPHTFAVRELLDQAAAESLLAHPSTSVRVECASDLSACADPERVHQVVANLIENAVRHSPTDAEVVVDAHDAHGVLVLSVTDAGPGISPEDAERVFERFYRADRARAGAAGGSGLGLAIVRWIVDLHSGDVGIDLEHSPGCRVTVTIPQQKAASL